MVADTCRPSYSLQDGNSAANSTVTVQSAVILSYLSQGYTVGALVQANFGRRPELTVAGCPGRPRDPGPPA